MTEMMNQDPKRNPPYIEEDDPAETEPAAEAAEAAEPVKEEKADKKSDRKLKNELAEMEKKLEAENLCHLKVSVITGCHAYPLTLCLLTPGALGAENTKEHCACNGIVHKLQRRVTAYCYIFFFNSKHIRKEALHLRNTVENTVVTAVNSILRKALLARSCLRKKRQTDIKLIGVRLSSRKIKLKSRFLILVIFFYKSISFLKKLFSCKFTVFFHK